MSSTQIETILWSLKLTAESLEREGVKYATWAYSAINYYVSTARASTAWIKALSKADNAKLIRRMMNGRDRSDQGMIQTATKYLKRYYGLTE